MKIFKTLECSGQNLSNSTCQFWNDKSIPLQILYPYWVSWKITPIYFFRSNNICFGQKEFIQVKTFDTFKSSGQNLSNFLCNFETTSRFLSKVCIPIQFHEIQLLCTSLAQTIHTFLKRSSLKWKFLRLSSAQVKICQIPYVNFETTSRFLSKFCIPLQFHERLLLCTFLAQAIYTLLKRSPLKWKFFRLSSARVKFCQTPYDNFETTSRFLSKFCIPLQFHER